MQCGNCGRSNVDTARFCSFCGAQQRAEPASQVASRDAPAQSPNGDDAFDTSEVTVILPRREASALIARAAARHDAMAAAAAIAAAPAPEEPTARRSRVPVMAIGGVAVIAIVAVVVAFALRPQRPATPPANAMLAAPATVTEEAPAVTGPPIQSSEAAGDAAVAEATSSTAPAEQAAAVEEAPIGNAVATPEATPAIPVPGPRIVSPRKDATPRKSKAAPAIAVTEPPPPEAPPPLPVEIAAPAPAAVTAAPPPAPAKVETVACSDVANPFSREVCLWQECAKPEYRSHAECARFTGPGGQR